jgi:hypothetical protein
MGLSVLGAALDLGSLVSESSQDPVRRKLTDLDAGSIQINAGFGAEQGGTGPTQSGRTVSAPQQTAGSPVNAIGLSINQQALAVSDSHAGSTPRLTRVSLAGRSHWQPAAPLDGGVVHQDTEFRWTVTNLNFIEPQASLNWATYAGLVNGSLNGVAQSQAVDGSSVAVGTALDIDGVTTDGVILVTAPGGTSGIKMSVAGLSGSTTTLSGVAVGNGAIYVAGTTNGDPANPGVPEWLVASVAADLSVVNWHVAGNHQLTNGDTSAGIALNADASGLAVVGTGYGSSETNNNTDLETLWFTNITSPAPNLVHDLLWQPTMLAADTSGTGIAVDSTGQMDVSGQLINRSTGEVDPMVAQVDGAGGSGGTIFAYGSSSNDPHNSFNGVAVDSADNIYVAGRLMDLSTGHAVIFVAKWNNTLTTETWNSRFGMTNTDEYANSIAVSQGDSGGIPFLAGTVLDPISGNTAIDTVELSRDGLHIVDQDNIALTGDNLAGNGIALDTHIANSDNAFLVGTDATVGDGIIASLAYA